MIAVTSNNSTKFAAKAPHSENQLMGKMAIDEAGIPLTPDELKSL